MKLDPGFPTHWKTERLIEQLGAEGVLVLLRIWGRAQIRREWTGLPWTPKRLAMETKWKGDANHLWEVLTDPEAPWLDVADDGTVTIHDFDEHQRQVIHLWRAGGKGGRPRKNASPVPTTPPKDHTDEKEEYSSSYPICEPNGNHMVNFVEPTMKNQYRRPTLDQAKAAAANIGMTAEAATAWWQTREASDWRKGTGGSATTPVGANWQADLANSRAWATDAAEKLAKASPRKPRIYSDTPPPKR